MLVHAGLRAPELTTVGAIAHDFGLSATHLNKVAQTLAAHGYLQTVRGRAGGLRLVRAPKEIRLGDVAAITEPDLHLAPCMREDHGDCPIYEPCVLRGILSSAAAAFIETLNQSTLADLLKRPEPLLFAIEKGRRQPAPAPRS